jgi:Domain of unknown function (DUF1772)
MNTRLESVLRFVNLTTSGLLAGSIGFGDAALVPGWQFEGSTGEDEAPPSFAYFNAIGPVALATAVTLLVGSRDQTRARRFLDSVATLGLVGVLATTVMVTVPINRELVEHAPVDYPSDRSQSLTRNWSRARKIRRSLGIGAFIASALSIIAPRRA